MPDSRQYKLAAEVLRQRAPTLSHEGRHAALDVANELAGASDIAAAAGAVVEVQRERIDQATEVLKSGVHASGRSLAGRAVAILETGIDPAHDTKGRHT